MAGGSLGLFAEYRDREATNRAWADPFEDAGTGVTDVIDDKGQVVEKNNPVDQPNHHWGDGVEEDILTFANFRMPIEPGRAPASSTPSAATAIATGPATPSAGTRATTGTGRELYPARVPAHLQRPGDRLVGRRRVCAAWSRAGTTTSAPTFGHNDFDYDMTTTNNASLGPCLETALRAGSRPDPRHRRRSRDPQPDSSFFSGTVEREEFIAGGQRGQAGRASGCPTRSTSPSARRSAGSSTGSPPERRRPGSMGSTCLRTASATTACSARRTTIWTRRPRARRSSPASRPTTQTDRDRTNFGLYADAETDLSDKWLANVAARFESYSDFGERITGKVAVRFQPSPRVTLRAAAAPGSARRG